ncbi:hypothetical protein M427DRAFT_68457 [Gonapodya prolifera JEL478]|uniref:TPR-like protein n=1 Tax=Gonapodya prolifera (strain JEL478) TaxID=1344416 RepID=A0A139ALL1_GONPJ|nr:hypothetical protein M427DRAFT_68457 [Gonapodya prolifera JEL478]|eukprot:KXS17315.1 hypothetical protein M427DRAFT_68457 [Gonapodya prolifera JEL478]
MAAPRPRSRLREVLSDSLTGQGPLSSIRRGSKSSSPDVPVTGHLQSGKSDKKVQQLEMDFERARMKGRWRELATGVALDGSVGQDTAKIVTKYAKRSKGEQRMEALLSLITAESVLNAHLAPHKTSPQPKSTPDAPATGFPFDLNPAAVVGPKDRSSLDGVKNILTRLAGPKPPPTAVSSDTTEMPPAPGHHADPVIRLFRRAPPSGMALAPAATTSSTSTSTSLGGFADLPSTSILQPFPTIPLADLTSLPDHPPAGMHFTLPPAAQAHILLARIAVLSSLPLDALTHLDAANVPHNPPTASQGPPNYSAVLAAQAWCLTGLAFHMQTPYDDRAVACWALVAEWDRAVRGGTQHDLTHPTLAPRTARSRPQSTVSSSIQNGLTPRRAQSAASTAIRSAPVRNGAAVSVHSSADSLAVLAMRRKRDDETETDLGDNDRDVEADLSLAWNEWDEWVEEAMWRIANAEIKAWEVAQEASSAAAPVPVVATWTRAYVSRFIAPAAPSTVHPATVTTASTPPNPRAARWCPVLRHHVRSLLPAGPSVLDLVPNVGVSLFPLPATSLSPVSLYAAQLAQLLPFPRAVDATATETERYERWKECVTWSGALGWTEVDPEDGRGNWSEGGEVGGAWSIVGYTYRLALHNFHSLPALRYAIHAAAAVAIEYPEVVGDADEKETSAILTTYSDLYRRSLSTTYAHARKHREDLRELAKRRTSVGSLLGDDSVLEGATKLKDGTTNGMASGPPIAEETEFAGIPGVVEADGGLGNETLNKLSNGHGGSSASLGAPIYLPAVAGSETFPAIVGLAFSALKLLSSFSLGDVETLERAVRLATFVHRVVERYQSPENDEADAVRAMAATVKGIACFLLWKGTAGGMWREVAGWNRSEVEGDVDDIQEGDRDAEAAKVSFDYLKLGTRDTLTVDYRARAEALLADAVKRLENARTNSPTGELGPITSSIPPYLPMHYLALARFSAGDIPGATELARSACIATPSRTASWHLLGLLVAEGGEPAESEKVMAAGWLESVVKRTGGTVSVEGVGLELLDGGVPGRFGWGSLGIADRVEVMRYKITHFLITRSVRGPTEAVRRLPSLFMLFKRLFPGFASQSAAVREFTESAKRARSSTIQGNPASGGQTTLAKAAPQPSNGTTPSTPITFTLSPPEENVSKVGSNGTTDGMTVTVVPASLSSNSRPNSMAESFTPAGAPSAFYHFRPYDALLHLWLVASALYRELGEYGQARVCIEEARAVVQVVADKEGERRDAKNGVDAYCGSAFEPSRKVERAKSLPAEARVRRCLVDVEVENAWLDIESKAASLTSETQGATPPVAVTSAAANGSTASLGTPAASMKKVDRFSRYRSATTQVQTLLDAGEIETHVDQDVYSVQQLRRDYNQPMIPISGLPDELFVKPLLPPVDLSQPGNKLRSNEFLVPGSLPTDDAILTKLADHLHSLSLLDDQHVPLRTTLGLIHLHSKNIPLAVYWFEKATKHSRPSGTGSGEPTSLFRSATWWKAQAWNGLGEVMRRTSRHDRAMECVKTAAGMRESGVTGVAAKGWEAALTGW